MIRPSLLMFWLPHRYLDTEIDWSKYNFYQFTHDFDYEMDDWHGLKDTVTPVEQTLNTADGDCDDYAAVAASYLLAETERPVRLALLWRGAAGHVVCYTDDTVYSSGEIHRLSLRRFCAEQNYTVLKTTTVRPV